MGTDGAPRKVVLEENGKGKIIPFEELQAAAQTDSVSPNARVWANGREYSWAEVKEAFLSGDFRRAFAPPPDSVSPSDPASDTVPVPPPFPASDTVPVPPSFPASDTVPVPPPLPASDTVPVPPPLPGSDTVPVPPPLPASDTVPVPPSFPGSDTVPVPPSFPGSDSVPVPPPLPDDKALDDDKAFARSTSDDGAPPVVAPSLQAQPVKRRKVVKRKKTTLLATGALILGVGAFAFNDWNRRGDLRRVADTVDAAKQETTAQGTAPQEATPQESPIVNVVKPEVESVESAEATTDFEPIVFDEEYALFPFDPNKSRIPSGYRGHNVFAFYAALAKLDENFKENEGETTTEFQKRVAELRRDLEQRGVLDGLGLDSILAFVVLPSGDEEAEVKNAGQTYKRAAFTEKYDADARTLTLKATTAYTNGFTFGFQNLAFASNVKNLGTYVEAAAAGDELEITRIEESSWGIRTKTRADFDDWAKFALTDVAPAQAESWKGKLGALCVCSIERNVLSDRPFTVFSSSQKLQPRKEAPFDGTRTNNEILVTDVEFWIYHVRNGDVIAKFDADGRRIDEPKEGATPSRVEALPGGGFAGAAPGEQVDADESQVEYESGIGREDVLRKLDEMQRLQILRAGRRGGY